MDLGHASRLSQRGPELLSGSEHRRAASYPQASVDASPVKVAAFPAAHELLNTILMSPSTRHILHHWDMLLPVQSQRPRHGLHSCGDK